MLICLLYIVYDVCINLYKHLDGLLRTFFVKAELTKEKLIEFIKYIADWLVVYYTSILQNEMGYPIKSFFFFSLCSSNTTAIALLYYTIIYNIIGAIPCGHLTKNKRLCCVCLRPCQCICTMNKHT